ncbi:MAG: hypothetical protein GXY33_10685 [Phycisphaerae bacterium]|mgnify:CR=1 FL=1|nr:hypothetical protein [Phycisphaerae bacterium]
MSDGQNQEGKVKVPLYIHALCGWPLLLVAVGGAVGGGLGGLAYGVNISLYKSSASRTLVWMLNPVVGAAAIVLWLIIGSAIQSAMR